MLKKSFTLILVYLICSCASKPQLFSYKIQDPVQQKPEILPGIYSLEKYIPLIKNKRIGLIINQSSKINNVLSLDTFLALNIHVKKIFVPEHGFRGTEDAGASIHDEIDTKTQLPIISLYGKNKKPTAKQLEDIDVCIFDIQDVGVRFYTYISTLHFVMEACAENGILLIVLDRANPNGHYVDGPVLDPDYSSFVGMHPIPIVYGLTIGELALMIKGEQWIDQADSLTLMIIPCTNYRHDLKVHLDVIPSPNLRTMNAIFLYPFLCLFEGTAISVGRGTKAPFEIYGHPALTKYDTSFIPRESEGAKHPILEDTLCYGYSLRKLDENVLFKNRKFNLDYLIETYHNFPDSANFFIHPNFFDKLAGNETMRLSIIAGKSVEEIRSGWQDKLEAFKKLRLTYLLYPDFIN